MGRKMFWVGIAGVIISLLMFLVGWLFPFFWGLFFLGFPILILSLSVSALGLIIWLCAGDGKKKQVAGCILCLVGPIGFLIVHWLFEAGARTDEDIPQLGLPLLGLEVGVISFILLVVGIILFIIGRSQAKKQKNQNPPEMLEDK
jgi:hypothetical protein